MVLFFKTDRVFTGFTEIDSDVATNVQKMMQSRAVTVGIDDFLRRIMQICCDLPVKNVFVIENT